MNDSLATFVFTEDEKHNSSIINALKKDGITTLSQLEACTKGELLRTPRLGLKGVKAIEQALNISELTLGQVRLVHELLKFHSKKE